ncbi:SDR family NAD(P)-dependent oxidoreductase [Enemella sp. A6]|uniref:SDR family NAD(P)-dependent oxidoreductase n=1 Tax=Enemella sp. A6 TaxID=3440152 RepID=UPI003EBB45D0
MEGLSGRVAVVTGASRGIGAAIARALAGAGVDVLLTGRDEVALSTTVDACGGAGVQAEGLVADVTDPETPGRLIEAVLGHFGRLDIWVNSHGGTLRKAAREMTATEWDAIQNLNLRSTFLLCQAAAEIMREQRRGSIINVASLNSVVGNAWAAGYAASKGGVAQLTKSLALEWAGDGIRVNGIGPGMVETDMTRPLSDTPERMSALLAHIPMGRFARPEEMGGAAVFLASDAASYVTGQIIYVDGGYLCV